MGVESYVYFFDLDRLDNQVIPALQEVAMTGTLPDWRLPPLTNCRATDLQTKMIEGQACREELLEALSSPALDPRASIIPEILDLEVRGPDAPILRLDEGPPPTPPIPDIWREIMGCWIELCCCEDAVSLFRAHNATTWIWDLVDSEWAEKHGPLSALLRRLSGRLMCWNEHSGGHLDGVHGWLDAEECAQLVQHLAPLDLLDAPPPEGRASIR